jgi:hypothetical protein
MTINELTNEEVLFMYFENHNWLTRYQSIIKEKVIVDQMNIIGLTEIRVTEKLEDEDIDEICKAPHYKMCVSVHEKLHPIVELIEEVNPELYNKVQLYFTEILI